MTSETASARPSRVAARDTRPTLPTIFPLAIARLSSSRSEGTSSRGQCDSFQRCEETISPHRDEACPCAPATVQAAEPEAVALERKLKKPTATALPLVSATSETLEQNLRPLIASAELRHSLGNAGHRYVEQVHDVDQIAEQLIQIYQRISA